MPTIADLKRQIQAQIAPGNDVEFLRIVQEADMRLLGMGRWRWTKTRIVLTETDGYVTLPYNYASILGLQINNFPTDIRAEEFEFVPDGVGDIKVGEGNLMLIDQGINTDGLRSYKLTGHLPSEFVLHALVLYAPSLLYDEDIGEEDVPEEAVTITRCPDVTALKLACFGTIYEENHDMAAAESYFSRAAKVLDEAEQNQRGSSRQQVNMRPFGRGVRRIRSFR